MESLAARIADAVAVRRIGTPFDIRDSVSGVQDLEDRAALAAHLTDKAAGQDGISLDELDAALDRIDAETLS